MNTLNFKLIPTVIIIILSSLFTLSANTFVDISGEPKKVSDYIGQGKWVVLMIWAADCHICNEEAESYANFHQSNKDGNAIVLGLNLDGQHGKSKAEDFIKRHGITFDNLVGEFDDVAQFYSSNVGASWIGTPTFMIYKPDGTLAAQQVGGVPTHLIENFIAKNSTE